MFSLPSKLADPVGSMGIENSLTASRTDADALTVKLPFGPAQIGQRSGHVGARFPGRDVQSRNVDARIVQRKRGRGVDLDRPRAVRQHAHPVRFELAAIASVALGRFLVTHAHA